MREEKLLVRLLRRLAELVAEEANKNPDFAAKLESVLAEVPRPNSSRIRAKSEAYTGELPDIVSEFKARGLVEFELWLRDLGIPQLRALIKHYDFDASRRSQKWNDTMKYARLISEQLQARLSRGSSFLRPASQ